MKCRTITFLLLVGCHLITADLLDKPSNACAGKISGSVENPSNCTLYYKCSNQKAIPSMCGKNYWFNKNLGKCSDRGLFSEEDIRKCEQIATETNKFIKIRRCYIDPQIEVEWKHDQNSNEGNKANSLPNEILMKLPVGYKMTKLRLVKKPQANSNLHVITNTRGRIETWNASESEEWNVYSDLQSESSVSVATHDINGTKKVIYDGSFVVNQTKYYMRSDIGKRSIPLSSNKTRQVSINGTNYLLTEDNSLTGPRDYQRAALSTADNSSVMSQLEKLVNAQYQSSSSKRRFGLELFIVLDYSIFYKWFVQSAETDNYYRTLDAINNIRYFYTHIVNGINDRYSSIQESDVAFYVKLVGYYIAQTPGDSQFTEKAGIKLSSYATEAYYALDEFEKWIVTESKRVPSRLPRFDSAALFTDYTMLVYNYYFNDTYTITGLANIGATCTVRGVSINKDFGQYATIETASHEIGHNLGAQHDGYNNLCSPSDQHIMSPAPGSLSNQTFNNPFSFSSCSINYFRNYIAQLDQGNNNCLLNEAYDADPTNTAIFLQQYPGQKYGIDKQCKLLYGQNSYYCAGGGERDMSICRELKCWNPSTGSCVSRVEQRALDGTTCANKSWCIRGSCTYDFEAPNAATSCIYGDYKENFSVQSGQISCSYMTSYMPWMCYDKYYFDLCCSSCGKIKITSYPGCEYGDRDASCSSISSRQCYDAYKKTQCCATCLKKEVNLPDANCRYGDKVDWCSTITSTGCYGSSDNCCQTCLRYNTGIQGCEYGDKFGGCTDDHCKDSYFWSSCCRTCRPYMISSTIKTTASTTTSTTTTTTTTTTSRPSSICPQGDLASWCSSITSDSCYGSKDTCCKTCQKFYNPSNTGCEYGDKASWCSSYVRSSIDCQRPEVATLCCASCRIYITPTSEQPSCPYGDQAAYCATVNSWDCYNYKSTCCISCAKYYNSTNQNCEYGDKVDWCSSYVQGPTECQRPEVLSLCCKTCANIKKPLIDPVCLDKADWCTGLFAGFCYDANTETTCCATCKKYLNGRTGVCRYGDFYSWCQQMYCSMNSVECCQSCK